MPLFRFRLEAQDNSGHVRIGTINAESKDEAKAFLLGREATFVTFQMDEARCAELCERYGVASVDDLPAPAPSAATEEEKAPFRALGVRDRSHLNLHRQSEPYKLVELKELT